MLEPYKIVIPKAFCSDVKNTKSKSNKYPCKPIRPFVKSLKKGICPEPSDRITLNLRKKRIKLNHTKKGKSSGARIWYLLDESKKDVSLLLYHLVTQKNKRLETATRIKELTNRYKIKDFQEIYIPNAKII